MKPFYTTLILILGFITGTNNLQAMQQSPKIEKCEREIIYERFLREKINLAMEKAEQFRADVIKKMWLTEYEDGQKNNKHVAQKNNTKFVSKKISRKKK